MLHQIALMKGKNVRKPKKLKLTEDQLTWFVMEQALYNPKLTPEQGSELIKANLAARKERERVARVKVQKEKRKRESK